jgi:hypothetical protein
MRRAYRSVLLRLLYVGLAVALSVAAGIATPAPPTTIGDLTDQRKVLYQSELEQNLLLRTKLGYGFIAAFGPLQHRRHGSALAPDPWAVTATAFARATTACDRAGRRCPRQAPPQRPSTVEDRRSRDAPALHYPKVGLATRPPTSPGVSR